MAAPIRKFGIALVAPLAALIVGVVPVPARADHCETISVVAGVAAGPTRAGTDLGEAGCATDGQVDTRIFADATHFWVLVPFDVVPATSVPPTGTISIFSSLDGTCVADRNLTFGRNDLLSRWESQSVFAGLPDTCLPDSLGASVGDVQVRYRGAYPYAWRKFCDSPARPPGLICWQQ